MIYKICPRCNTVLYGNQTMHWSCFVERAWHIFLILGIAAILAALLFIISVFGWLRANTSQNNLEQIPVADLPIALIAEPTTVVPTPLVSSSTASSLSIVDSVGVTPSPKSAPTSTVESKPTPYITVYAVRTVDFSGLVNTDTLNLRQGPSTAYPSLGKLAKGLRIVILGRNPPSTWLFVSVSTQPQRGWVSADYIQRSVALGEIPIVESPPLPPSPTERPKPISTATLLPPPGVVLNFYVEQDTISRGSCTMLHWGIENVREIYLQGRGVRGYDQEKVCPGTTTIYTIRIVLKDGTSIERNILVQVE